MLGWDAAHAPQRVCQEQGNLKWSKIPGGLERSDRLLIQRAFRAEAAHAPKRVCQSKEI